MAQPSQTGRDEDYPQTGRDENFPQTGRDEVKLILMGALLFWALSRNMNRYLC